MRSDIIQKRGYHKDTVGNDLSLKIASYPETARYLTERLDGSGRTACELCCGIGISLIELAKVFDKVVGVDNDELVIADCEKNLKHAGIQNYELIIGDISHQSLLARIKADVVLYDIPYWSNHDGIVDPDRQNPDLKKLITDIRETITSKIVIYAPPHMSYEEVRDQLGECEFLEVYLNGKHDRSFIFLGDLAKSIGKNIVTLTAVK